MHTNTYTEIEYVNELEKIAKHNFGGYKDLS